MSTCIIRSRPNFAHQIWSKRFRSKIPARAFETASEVQTLTASRILAHPAKELYELIADIDAYQEFVPYCVRSTVTAQSEPEIAVSGGRRWPRTADLQVGYGSYDTIFTSRIYCEPYRGLEAVTGSAKSTLSMLEHYKGAETGSNAPSGSLIESLLTRWTFHEYPFKPMPPDGQTPQQGSANANPSLPRTQVSLLIEAQLSNPMYGLLLQSVKSKIAGLMIDAFEKRALEKLGRGHHP